MNAVSIGQFVMAADRFAVVLGIVIFILVTGILAWRIDERLNRWSLWVLIGGTSAARLGHVALHWESFAAEPLRVFAFWQGGFYWPAAAAAVGLSLLLVLKTGRLRLWALLPLALALVVWNTALQLSSIRAVALPAMAFHTLTGENYDFARRPSTAKVINLWASWCPPCRREMPTMADVAAATDDVEFIFANQGESSDIVERYLAKEGLSLDTVVLDQFGDLRRHYGAPGLPATLFVSANGTLRHAHLGEISREVLQTRISQLTEEP